MESGDRRDGRVKRSVENERATTWRRLLRRMFEEKVGNSWESEIADKLPSLREIVS